MLTGALDESDQELEPHHLRGAMRSGAAAAADEPTLCFGSEGSCHRAQLHDGSGLSRQSVVLSVEADSNCLASSEYYSVCCSDPCEDASLKDEVRDGLRATASAGDYGSTGGIAESSQPGPCGKVAKDRFCFFVRLPGASPTAMLNAAGGPISEGQKNRDLVKKTPGAGPPQRPRS